ncbi:Metallo-hydrolase/oxidoreductase [Rhizodiscina lignyota]|uniref:Metallo-hydrolase/oxidoreductase n=1 Tax=Rhizodiscina lignyota TaxID=1504668 RepID=A0A9P4IH55_9PEZI|nr:Metallo-hydrolase/oxidoreductase [Rhizodiscina lignyota]
MAEVTSLDALSKCPKVQSDGNSIDTFQILNVGTLEADEGWFTRGGGTSTLSNPNPPRGRRKMIIMTMLIDHPKEGLILFETGAGENYPEVWGAPINDIFARVDYDPEQELDKQIELTGHLISDVKMVIMGHLHLDHAGGLEHWVGTNVPIWVHEDELKHAFYTVATGTDAVYLPHYMKFDLNWQCMTGDYLEITQGITLRLAKGHTPGLIIMQVNLLDSGTWICTTDMYHVLENWEDNVPQGWLARDHDDWIRSHQMIRMLQRRTNANMLFGHCKKTAEKYKFAPYSYT